jgi:hypothetical protein
MLSPIPVRTTQCHCCPFCCCLRLLAESIKVDDPLVHGARLGPLVSPHTRACTQRSIGGDVRLLHVSAH